MDYCVNCECGEEIEVSVSDHQIKIIFGTLTNKGTKKTRNSYGKR